MLRIALVDNYDSFTWNLVHYLGEAGAEVTVVRNDAATVEGLLGEQPDALVISPGPCTPSEAGISLDLVRQASGEVPILGVCLGHQAIGQAFGGEVVRAPVPMHGKLSPIRHDGRGLFEGIEGPFRATRYHSLTVERATFPQALAITAETEDGIVMGLAHREHPTLGVQFHPESIASEQGRRIIANFLGIAGRWRDLARWRRSNAVPFANPSAASFAP